MVTITIETDNAAFEDDPGAEVARILAEYARRLDGESLRSCKLYDYNGNHVGDVEVTK